MKLIQQLGRVFTLLARLLLRNDAPPGKSRDPRGIDARSLWKSSAHAEGQEPQLQGDGPVLAITAPAASSARPR